MGWFKKWWASEPDLADNHHGPLPEQQAGDWIVMPYRLAEACRISIANVGVHPDLPDELRLWIGSWLEAYNGYLSGYFRQNYGPDIFPVLETITKQVWQASEKFYQEEHLQRTQESFNLWENEMGDEDGK